MSFNDIALALIEAEERLQKAAWVDILNGHPVVQEDAHVILGGVPAP